MHALTNDRSRVEGNLFRSFAIERLQRAEPQDGDEPDQKPNARLTLSFSSETPYLRSSYFDEPWIEILGHDPTEVDLSRLGDHGPVLANHSRRVSTADSPLALIGAVEKAWVENGKGYAEILLSRRDGMEGLLKDIEDGIVRNVSVGYQIQERTLIQKNDGQPDEYRVTKWLPLEISLVDIPADATVGLGRSMEHNAATRYRVIDLPKTENQTLTKESKMNTEIEEIRSVANGFGMGAFVDGMVAAGAPLDIIRTRLLTKKAELDMATNTRSGYSIHDETLENPSFRIAAMADGLASRYGGAAPSEPGSVYAHSGIPDLAREILELNNVRTGRMSRDALVRAAMGTSDFPKVLGGAGQQLMRQGYGNYTGGLKRVARQASAIDFRAKSVIQLSEAPTLEKVNENGEFKYGGMGDHAESYKIDTVGKIISLSRQALVNDNIGAFADLAMRFGRTAAEWESGFLVDLFTSNPVMSDAVALFHATHANLAGTAAVLSVDSLGIARKAMRLQKGLDGKTPIDASPKFLIVPAALETIAEQLLAALTPAKSTDVNPFSGRLELVVDPRLDAKSATAWYLAADPGVIEGLEYSYLSGQEGPMIETRVGFEVDGMEMKCRLDFGAGLLDFRGLFKNAGV